MSFVTSPKKKLLIVEDNELNREMLCTMLEEHYDLMTAENGLAGLQILQEHCLEISMVLLDVHMPVMDGYQLLDEIQKDALLCKIPIIVTTGSNSSKEEEEKCLAHGASDFITKPYNRNVILSRINNIIKLHDATRILSEIEYDDQTGLLTHEAFMLHAKRLIRQHPNEHFMLAISQLQHFKQYSDHYSPKVLDDVILENTRLIRGMMDTFDNVVCGRYGRSSFIALVIANQRFMDSTGPNYQPPVLRLPDGNTMTLKIGVCHSNDTSIDLHKLCQYAEIALESVMHQYSTSIAEFDDEMMQRHKRQELIEQTMRTAVEQKQLQVYYQPKHDCRTGKLAGAEALVRWIHPEMGFLSPGEFIPIFEQTGFVVEADYYVWERTCQNLSRWGEKGLRLVPISVNSSRKGFLQPDAIIRWCTAAKEAGAHAHHLHIEVTESLFMDSLDYTAKILGETRKYGIQFELDDFGTGFSSLNTLGTLPLDIVKLDMSFVRSIDKPGKALVIEACVALIHKLGMKVTAEGVETEEQLKKMQEMGVDYIQGYYFSKPLPEDEFEEYLRVHGQ